MRRAFELWAVALAHSERTVRIQRPVFRVVIAMICLRMRALVYVKSSQRANESFRIALVYVQPSPKIIINFSHMLFFIVQVPNVGLTRRWVD